MSAFQIFTQPSQQALDTAASVLSGATLTFLVTGTSTPTDAYSEPTLTTPLANPLSANAAGVFASVFLDPEVVYRIILKTQAGVTLQTWDPANENVIALITSQYIGLTLDSLKRTPAEIAADVTPVNYAYAPLPEIDVARYGVLPDGTDISTKLASVIDVAVALGGAILLFRPGTYRHDSQLVPETYVFFRGAGKMATTFDFRVANGGTNIAIDARGSGVGGFPADRKTISFRDLTLDFTNCGNQVKGLALGWNMRSSPLLSAVRVKGSADWGVGFLDQNWNISFVDVEMDGCGNTVANSTGWYKDVTVDSGTFNDITWFGGYTEACGKADSTAGGMNLQTTTSNRGFKFFGHQWENNRGTDQVLITNTASVNIFGPYTEQPAGAAEAVTAFEFQGCTGIISGGFIGATDANNDQAMQFKSNSDMQIDGVHFSGWAVADIDIQGSRVRVGRNMRGAGTQAIVVLDATAQISGSIVPAFEAQKSGNQTGIVTNTFTKVAFQTEAYDVTSAFDSATNYRFTPKTLGRYLLSASVAWDDVETANDQFVIAIYRNGVAYRVETVWVNATQPFNHTITCVANVTATTDYFEVFVRHLGTSNRTINADATATWFAGRLLEVN
jgi:hypothetical protein